MSRELYLYRFIFTIAGTAYGFIFSRGFPIERGTELIVFSIAIAMELWVVWFVITQAVLLLIAFKSPLNRQALLPAAAILSEVLFFTGYIVFAYALHFVLAESAGSGFSASVQNSELIVQQTVVDGVFTEFGLRKAIEYMAGSFVAAAAINILSSFSHMRYLLKYTIGVVKND